MLSYVYFHIKHLAKTELFSANINVMLYTSARMYIFYLRADLFIHVSLSVRQCLIISLK